MGNRFKGLPEYHQLIAAHGIIAAITFLFMVPAAIFIARFYYQNGRRALRLHIWIQILVVFLATVVLVLGWFAVGPQRSLTNPHHGIGVAIYVMIMFQFIFGSLIHHIEKGKTRYKIPLKLVVCLDNRHNLTFLLTFPSSINGSDEQLLSWPSFKLPSD
jgi:hypothetical protein